MIVRLLSSSGFSGNDCGGGYTLFHSPEQTSAGEKIILKESRYAKRERRERESSNPFSFQNKFKYKPSVFQNLFIVSKIFPPTKSDLNDEQIFGEGKEKNNFRRK